MGLETATYISQLVASNPVVGDDVGQGDNHLRLIKAVLQAQFPNFTAAALASTNAQLDAAVAATVSGMLQIVAGTAGAPAIYTSADHTTGVYSAGTAQLNVAIAGTELLAMTAAGLNLTSGTLQFAGTNVFPLASTAYGAGSVLTAAIAASNVTYAKLQNETAHTLLGNPTGSAAAPSEITLGTGLSFTGSTLNGVAAPTFYAPNITVETSGTGATYTTPTNGGSLPLYLHVKMVGGGGGGAGAGGGGNGGAGGNSAFASWTAVGGTGGNATTAVGGSGGSGGTNGTGALIERVSGQSGGRGQSADGVGGGTPLGPGAMGGETNTTAGMSPSANTGAGGSAGNNAGTPQGGGGGGEYVEFVVTSPASSYTYTVGAAGTAGTGTDVGGAGDNGVVIIEAHWQ